MPIYTHIYTHVLHMHHSQCVVWNPNPLSFWCLTMNFKLQPMDAGAQDHHQKPIYHPLSSSTFSFFTERAIPGLANSGLSNGTYGGGCLGQDVLRRRFETREEIRWEIEKERVREEIIAEVRNELMMEREMAMRSGGRGFSSPVMPVSLPSSHGNVFEPRILHQRPIGLKEELVMSIDRKYGRGGHLRGNRGFSASPLQLLGGSPEIIGIPTPLPEDKRKEVIVLGSSQPDGEILSRTKRKSAPQVSEGSSQPGANRSKKRVKEEWSCAICQVSTTSECGLTEHLQGKKHRAKEADLVAHRTGANFGLGLAPKKPIIKPAMLALTTVNPSSSEEKKSQTRKKLLNHTPETNKTSSTSDPSDMKKKDETLSGTKQKSALPVSEGSSQLGSDTSKKKVKEEWSCAICQVSVTSERGLTEHLRGKKHQSKEAALTAYKTGADFGLAAAPVNPSSSEEKKPETRKESVNQTPETNKTSSTSNPNEMKKKDETNAGNKKRDAFKFWCEMCHVGAFSETVMNAHKEGKKHLARLIELYRTGKVDSEASATSNTCEDKSETETNQTAVVETVAAEVKPVKDDMKCVAAVVAEENITMTAGFGFC